MGEVEVPARRNIDFELLHDMETVSNGSFILVGKPNVTVLNISASGQLLFTGSFGAESEEPASIQSTLHGNYMWLLVIGV
jgi:hypothetical protein